MAADSKECQQEVSPISQILSAPFIRETQCGAVQSGAADALIIPGCCIHEYAPGATCWRRQLTQLKNSLVFLLSGCAKY